jgi:hypothetical protein
VLQVEVVAIERPDGLLVDRLLDAGMRVLALHPNQVKAARDRFRASGGKSDRFVRFVLCELARTDGAEIRDLASDEQDHRGDCPPDAEHCPNRTDHECDRGKDASGADPGLRLHRIAAYPDSVGGTAYRLDRYPPRVMPSPTAVVGSDGRVPRPIETRPAGP